MKFLFTDKHFYKTLFKLTIPIALQNLINSSLNFIDTVMIGKLGETQIAAVGLANQLFFLLILFFVGISTGASIFTAQYWGKKNIKGIRNVLGICLFTSVSVSILFSISAYFFPEFIMKIFTKDSSVIICGAKYLKTVSLCYVFSAITFSYISILRSTEKVNLPTIVSFFSVLINIFLNYILIFGKFGFNAMGVKGAALATVIARSFECIIIVSIIYIKKYEIAANLKELFNFSFSYLKKFFNIVFPVILNELTWALGIIMYNIAYARINTEAIAAVNIVTSIERIAFVGFIGLFNGSAIIIGKKIGENNYKKVFEYSAKVLILAPLLGAIAGLLIFLLSDDILSLYNISQNVYNNAKNIIIFLSLLFCIKQFNLLALLGVFRSAGDTKFCFYVESSAVWFIGVPIAFLGAVILKWPVYIVYLAINTEEVVKCCFLLKRYFSKKWIHHIVEH